MKKFDTSEIDKLRKNYNEEKRIQYDLEKMEEAFNRWKNKNKIRLTEDNYNDYWEQFLREYRTNNDEISR